MGGNRSDLADMTLDELADRIAHGSSEWLQNNAKAELMRRQAVWQMQATEAQAMASKASVEATLYTKKNAHYMLLSVFAMLVTAGESAVIAYLSWAYPHAAK